MTTIINFDDLPIVLDKLHSRGTLVLVGGVFDIIHPGHRTFLQEAKKHGETLLVMLESDEAVKQKKGDSRPIHNQLVRAQTLSEIADVDAILLLPYLKSDLEYYTLVKTLEPDIIAVTDSDPAYNNKKEQAEMVGGKVVIVTKRLAHSTTDLIKNG